MIDWNRVTTHINPNEMLDIWKHCVYHWEKKKRVKNKRFPCITNELLREMHKRNFRRKNATSTNNPLVWKQSKGARNKANKSVKKAKRKYFSENLDAHTSKT